MKRPAQLTMVCLSALLGACSDTLPEGGAQDAPGGGEVLTSDVSFGGADGDAVTANGNPDTTVEDAPLPLETDTDGATDAGQAGDATDAEPDASILTDAEGQPTDNGSVADTDPVDATEDEATVSDAVDPTPDSGSEVVSDTGVGSDAGGQDTLGPPTEGLYLVSVDYYGTDLQKVDAATGETTAICKLDFSVYPSLTFSRANKLFASRGGSSLDIIDPCTCEVTSVGNYGGFTGVNGITSDKGVNLYGVANIQDEFIAISTTTGQAGSLGALGFNFGPTGATWSDGEQTVYAIDATTDGLYTIDASIGAATLVTPLDYAFGTVGIELHPANGVIYACSNSADLLTVDPSTGEVTVVGPMTHSGACTNLAAPWAPIPCLDTL